MDSARSIIRLLDLKPHPEGGHFRETFRDARESGGRSAGTAIYFLLARGERSHWRRADAVSFLATIGYLIHEGVNRDNKEQAYFDSFAPTLADCGIDGGGENDPWCDEEDSSIAS